MKSYRKSPKNAKYTLKYNDYYASVFVRKEVTIISAEHRALMESGKAKRKASNLPHSAAKRRTFRDNYRRIDLKKTPGTPYFFTLKPVAEIDPEHFAKALQDLTRMLKSAKSEYIYMLEWAKHEEAPHIHLVANIPGNTEAEIEAFAGGIIRHWSKKTPRNYQTNIKQDARPVYDAPNLFGYMSKQTPDELNARAIVTGKDWSVISVTGCSRDWTKSRFDIIDMSRETGVAIKRELKHISGSRGIRLNKCSKGCDNEMKRAISEVSPFSISGLPRSESARLLSQVIDSQPLKERKFLIEMRDLFRQAHKLGSQETKDEIERLLLDNGYEMRHMFPEWEKPQVNMAERYNTNPTFRLLCKARKQAKEARLK